MSFRRVSLIGFFGLLLCLYSTLAYPRPALPTVETITRASGAIPEEAKPQIVDLSILEPEEITADAHKSRAESEITNGAASQVNNPRDELPPVTPAKTMSPKPLPEDSKNEPKIESSQPPPDKNNEKASSGHTSPVRGPKLVRFEEDKLPPVDPTKTAEMKPILDGNDQKGFTVIFPKETQTGTSSDSSLKGFTEDKTPGNSKAGEGFNNEAKDEGESIKAETGNTKRKIFSKSEIKDWFQRNVCGFWKKIRDILNRMVQRVSGKKSASEGDGKRSGASSGKEFISENTKGKETGDSNLPRPTSPSGAKKAK